MKVEELIRQLEQLPGNSEIQVTIPVGCCGDSEIVDITDVDVVMDSGFIWTSVFPLLNSCRKLGDAMDRDRRKSTLATEIESIIYNIKSCRAGDGDTRTWEECASHVEADLENIVEKYWKNTHIRMSNIYDKEKEG